MIIQGRLKVKKRGIILFSRVTVQTQAGCRNPVSGVMGCLKFLQRVLARLFAPKPWRMPPDKQLANPVQLWHLLPISFQVVS